MTQPWVNGFADWAQRTVEYILNTWGAFDLSHLHAGGIFAVVAV